MCNEKITNVRIRNGQITHVKLDNGQVLSLDEAIAMIQTGHHLLDYVTGVSKNFTPFIRTRPDLDTSNNLQNLPEF